MLFQTTYSVMKHSTIDLKQNDTLYTVFFFVFSDMFHVKCTDHVFPLYLPSRSHLIK